MKIDTSNSRAYTCAILELMDEGVFDTRALVQSLLVWMSEKEVKEFAEYNFPELFKDTEDIGEEDLADEDCDWYHNPNSVMSRHHY